jgi:small-conductance mechanosensitive channel
MLTEIQKKQLEAVSNHRNKNEKLSFNRKIKKLEELVEAVKPLEEEILKLFLQKQPLMDEISELRNEMVKECIHPLNYLIHKGDHILCKFCDAKISLPKINDE